MTGTLRVAVAQIAARVGALDHNVDRHVDMIARARAAGADLLVFPELSLTGHHGSDELLDVAMDRGDARLRRLAEAAGPMRTVVGLIEEGPAAQFYNAAVVLRGGRVEHLHRKINLPTYGKLEEGKHYATGRFVETLAMAERWRMGLLICADLWNPALTHLAFLHGATLLVSPISSAREAVGAEFDNPAGWALAARFYAVMYGAPVIVANRCGVERDLTFWGGSRVVGPDGRVLAEAGEGEEMLTVDLDYDAVRQARRLLPTVRDSNLALVQRETNRLIESLGIPDGLREDG
ncbi:MAG: nitrilase-related carbon-nitrogen hydrolase [Paracoccaceae bacterium]